MVYLIEGLLTTFVSSNIKALGGKTQNFLRHFWVKVCERIMQFGYPHSNKQHKMILKVL
jgi:hypothetical protein